MKKKVCVVINDINRALEHEWFVTHINKELFSIEFVLINCRQSKMASFLTERSVPCYHYNYNGKSDIPILFFKLLFLFLRKRYHTVHTHLFLSSLIALPAAWLAFIKKRVMTRHYSDFHHVWFPASLKYDKFMNRFVTDFIAISRNVRDILVDMENIPDAKITVIHHGLDLGEYSPSALTSERVESMKRNYNLSGVYPVIGVVSRFTELKGIQFIIPAFQEFLESNPEAVLVLANASGDYESEIVRQLNSLPSQSYRLIKFEPDIAALFSLFSVFIHVPVTLTAEAFGQTYIEAMAMKIPGIFTVSGVLAEFGADHVNCLIVPYKDSGAILNGLKYIISHPEDVKRITDAAYDDVLSKFDFQIKIKKLQAVYLR